MPRKRKILLAIWSILCVLWIAFIFSNSWQTATQSTQSSTSVLHILNHFLAKCHIPIALSSFFVRKAAHFIEFAILGALLARESTLLLPTFAWQCFTPIIGVTVAVFDETIQYFTPGRAARFTDVCIDTCGMLCGFFVIHLCFGLHARHKRKKQEKAG